MNTRSYQKMPEITLVSIVDMLSNTSTTIHVRAPEKNGEIIYHLPIPSHCSCVFMFRSVNVNTSNPASELPKLVDHSHIKWGPIKMAVALKGLFDLKLFSKSLVQSIIIQVL